LLSAKKRRAVDGRKEKVEQNWLTPIKGFAFRESVAFTAVYLLLSTLKKEYAMAFAFEKLIVYQKAVDFADKICATILVC